MNSKSSRFVLAVLFLGTSIFLFSCKEKSSKSSTNSLSVDTVIQKKLNEFVEVSLTTDLSKLTDKEKQMLPLMIEAAQIMDEIFWEETCAPKDSCLGKIQDSVVRRFAEINYGPWERLNENKAFISSYGEKPKGACFYPKDMTKEEFENFKDPNKTSEYTLIRRNADGSLKTVWYHEAFKEKVTNAADLLKKCAALAEDPGLKNYLELRADALLTDDYFKSDMAWMDMKTNTLDLVVGPIENYEDELFGYKTAHESSVLVKDKEWSKRLEKFTALLPEMQKQLPVEEKYKKEKPGSNSDLNAYDILYYAGNSNSGAKTIAINLPNDEKVQLAKGSRRLQLKNTMKAKFDNILEPIAKVLIDPAQQSNIKFDAFFNNVMFHEVAHGLGIKNTINGKGLVKASMKEYNSAFEEAKADVLGLFLVGKLIERGDLKDISIQDCYVTYMAGLIRSVRFGAGEAHGQANMMCFNFFEDNKAFTRNADGTYKVDVENTKKALDAWAAKVLIFQGNGDYDGASAYLKANGKIRPDLQADLGKLKTAHIPVDIYFKQGVAALGLK
ncbi:MAG: Zn-dependent hydrolase [Bacteroidota bacterium]